MWAGKSRGKRKQAGCVCALNLKAQTLGGRWRKYEQRAGRRPQARPENTLAQRRPGAQASEDTAFSGRGRGPSTGTSGQPAFEPSPGGGRGLPDARPMPGRAFPHLRKGADRHQGRAGQSFPAIVPSGISGQASPATASGAGRRAEPAGGLS